jgi:hypothetical protein
MAKSVALSALRVRTRELANMEAAVGATVFVPDDELDRRINRALEALYDKLILARGADYYVTEATFPTVAGTTTYNLASDFYQLLEIIADDGNLYVNVPMWRHQERARLLQLGVSNTSGLHFLRYRLTPTQFELLPTPQSVYTITYRYVPAFVDLADPADTFDGVNGWHEWACLTAATGMLAKEESDPSTLMAERAAIDQRISQLAGARDAGQPEVVQDVASDWGGEYNVLDWYS